MKTEVKIGITGVVAIAALFLGINFLKGVDLFSPTETYYITFSNAKGLTKSSPVYADGYQVGRLGLETRRLSAVTRESTFETTCSSCGTMPSTPFMRPLTSVPLMVSPG